MSAKGEDKLTQIQKYKALLALNRRKSNAEMAKKSKKHKHKKDDNKPAMQPLLEDNVVAASSSGFDKTEVKENTIVHDKNNDVNLISKGTAMTGTVQQSAYHSIAQVSQPATSTSQLTNMSNDKEVTEEMELTSSTAKVEESESKVPEFEKSKKGRLSFRRKRKKSKATNPEADNNATAAQDEKKDEKKEPEIQPESEEITKENADVSSAEATEIASPEQCEMSESPAASDVKDKKKGSPDNKEKVSRTKKFKRWASFSKKKEEGSSDSLSSKAKDKETKQKSDDGVQNNDTMNDAENNSNDSANSPSRMSKEERRKRSVSFAETVKYHDDDLLPEPEPRKRSASFGEETTVELFDTVAVDEEEKKTVDEPKETTTTTQELEPELDEQAKDDDKNNIENNPETEEPNSVQNNEIVIENASLDKDNEEENDLESDAEQKDVKTDDEYATATGDMTGEENDDKETTPKKKKKRFLRKLSRKNIKGSKKETKSLTKSDISLPFEVQDGATTEDAAEQSEPEEKSQENSSKRKKSVLGLKLPKALKKRKSSAGYKVIAGTDAEKELQKDEEHDKESIEGNTEKKENISEQAADADKPAEKPVEINEEQNENTETTSEIVEEDKENSTENDEQLELCDAKETEVQKDEDTAAQQAQIDSPKDGEKDQQIAETPDEESDQQAELQETQPEKNTVNESENEEGIMPEVQELAEEEPEKADQKENEEPVTDEQQDELQDSSLSVSEITLIEMGDESSLLAMPVAKDSAQQSEIHELPIVTSPEITQSEQDNEKENETETELPEPEVPSTPTETTNEPDVEPSVSRALSPECLSPDVCAKLRSFEMSVCTKAMVDSYILIDQQLEVSQDFLQQIELMDNREKNRCFVM